MSDNLILKTDSYKFSHPYIFPDKMTYSHFYLESRGGDLPATLFFGLQYILKKHFSKPITMKDIEEAEKFAKLHGVPFCKEGWERIVKVHNGNLPIRVRAVPEGTLVPLHNVLMTVESTDEKLAWLPGHLEGLFVQIWYPMTVATRSHYVRKMIMEALNTSSDNPEEEIEFKHHSFGFRACSSVESSEIGGMAELLSTKGTDTIQGILGAMEYYGADVCGFSISASEHSTIISWKREGEVDAYRNMIKNLAKPGGIIACVSDSYDVFKACSHIWGEILKQDIIDSGATLVIRLDSGDPCTVIKDVLFLLEEKFGTQINSKGYKVLNNVRILQGDGININSIPKILKTVMDNGFSITNLALGQGGGSLQLINRDTFKFAMKASCVVVDEEIRDISKDPITDPGKRSKIGYLSLICKDGNYETVKGYHPDDVLEVVYENGELLIDDNFEEIRKRTNK